jgi:hypothetical protein
MLLFHLFSVSLFFLCACPVWGQEVAGRLYDIPLGQTRLDITGDGKPEIIFKALRENNNAHSYNVTLFMQDGDVPSLIGIDTKTVLHELTSSAESECGIYDNRLLVGKNGTSSILITANRALTDGQDFCALVPVQLEFFRLTENSQGLPGWPQFYFKSFKTWATNKNYDTVANALKENEKKLIHLAK